ncbi:unnamed protein product, partial [Durusdinium trenchii]
IVKLLIKDKILPNWKGKLCPKCNEGTLSPLKVHCGDTVAKYRCSRKACQQRIHPYYLRPFFQACRGPEALLLQIQAGILLLLLLRVVQSSIHLLLGVNRKAVEGMQRRLECVREKYVEKREKSIVFGKNSMWADVEADEAMFDKRDLTNDAELSHQVKGDHCLLWEQWCGLAYKLKLPGVIHDSVVHQKKRVKLKGKWVWTKPSFLEVVSRTLPDGKRLKAKAGTQHIDRCWKFLKDRLGTHNRAGMACLGRKFGQPSMSTGTGAMTYGYDTNVEHLKQEEYTQMAQLPGREQDDG